MYKNLKQVLAQKFLKISSKNEIFKNFKKSERLNSNNNNSFYKFIVAKILQDLEKTPRKTS